MTPSGEGPGNGGGGGLKGGVTVSGLVLGAFAALMSPQAFAQLSGREVFWLMLVALLLTGFGESVIPALARLFGRPSRTGEYRAPRKRIPPSSSEEQQDE